MSFAAMISSKASAAARMRFRLSLSGLAAASIPAASRSRHSRFFTFPPEGVKASSHGPARAQQANPHRRFRPAMLGSDLPDFEPIQIVALEDNAILLPAALKNPSDVNRGKIDFRRRRDFRQCLHWRLASQEAPVNVQRDAVHPRQHHAGIA
jgi:hypothetical protein